ncbi:phosphatidylinositol 3-kinase [Malassezia vespertilionis]|uniref:phosphatidylinositol 3-kinase n=1 Tax=Malassezia vespertilionis TaxID=2020962 RepID=UPI0024B1345C|nr:phosphatidylinositol 3-kinase [Malassezia vespertilionis]WFD07652.1 phosphatidylinositol 3-kinase [Malassezia vespertilionis]
MDKDVYSFVAACDVQEDVYVHILDLEGPLPHNSPAEIAANAALRLRGENQGQGTLAPLRVVCQLYADTKPIALPECTQYMPFADGYRWDRWIHIPYAIAALPIDAMLVFTVLDISMPDSQYVVGGTTLPLFGRKGSLRRGKQKMRLWRGVVGDTHVPSATPHELPAGAESVRLEKLKKKHARHSIPSVDWLDAIAQHTMEQIHTAAVACSSDLVLNVEVPAYELPVVFAEPEAQVASSLALAQRAATVQTVQPSLFTVYDPEALGENLVEAKHRRLVRSQRSNVLDRDQKPTASIRDELNGILLYSPTRVLTSAEMDVIWSFRFYLARHSKGLTKFLKSVVWTDAYEARQATEVLLPMWAEPDLADALELLGPVFLDLRVRAYAVRLLARADDEELELYLLQLVQALKFDETAWKLTSMDTPQRMLRSLRHSAQDMHDTALDADKLRLSKLLCARSAANPVLGTMFYWYVKVETDDARHGELYTRVLHDLQACLQASNPSLAQQLVRQGHFVSTLAQYCQELRRSKEARPKKIERLRALLQDKKSGLATFVPPLPLPLDPMVHVSCTIAANSTIFKSNQFPLRIEFCAEESEFVCEAGAKRGSDTKSSGTYTIICKNGDDLRQDQLVIQLFTLMDRLMRHENLDLRITPYHVLATGVNHGMVQYIPSMPIATIMAEYGGSLLEYMRVHHPDPRNAASFYVQPSVLDTFVRSCGTFSRMLTVAGYCVITYLLGVGDRHLDNLLVAPDGHFFHVDFGYILGRDPKPFPPPVKVCKEMVDGMGGTSSVYYKRFKQLCHTAFACLRRNANLILNLVSLMVDANIPDIRVEPDKAVLKVQEKFMLDMSEENAVAHFEALLNETSYLSTMFDRLHNMAQYFRQ